MSDRPIIGNTVGTPMNPSIFGSSVDIVTEFDDANKEYEENQVYNANAINAVLIVIAEMLDGFATKNYVDKQLGVIENGSY